MSTVIRVEGLGKQYRLGEIGTGTLSHDLNRWMARMRGKEDPFAKIGESNEQAIRGESDYVWALQDINFEVKAGDVLGIIGKNGAGKSTLLKILSKVTKPSTGRILTKGRIASLLEVGTGFHPEMTGRENIFLNGAIMGMTRIDIRKKFDEIVDFAGVERYLDTPVKRYSSGMYVRLAFAVAAHLESEILIVDEILAVGDAEFQKKCIGKMKNVSNESGKTVLFVSHQLNTIFDLCTKGILLGHGGISAKGTAKEVIENYLGGKGTLEFINIKETIEAPEIRKAIIDKKELQKGNLLVNFEFVSPFNLNPPIIGVTINNGLRQPVLSSNARMHSDGYKFEQSTKEGRIRLSIKNLPLLSGSYSMSIFLGDNYQDFSSYTDILNFEFQSQSVDNSKIPDINIIGSVNVSNANWSSL